MSSGPAVWKRHASRLFTVHCRMTQACFDHPRMCPPRHAFNAGRGEAQRTESYRGKNRPACPRTVLGLPQQRVALMYGPGPGLLSMYKKRGALLYPFTCARAVGAAPTVTPRRTGEMSQGKTEAQDNQSNAKAKTTKSRGQPQQPRQGPYRGSSPHTNRASHP